MLESNRFVALRGIEIMGRLVGSVCGLFVYIACAYAEWGGGGRGRRARKRGVNTMDHIRSKRHNRRQMLSLFILADSPCHFCN